MKTLSTCLFVLTLLIARNALSAVDLHGVIPADSHGDSVREMLSETDTFSECEELYEMFTLTDKQNDAAYSQCSDQAY